MRIVPTRDKAKLAAVKGLFDRYATEAVTFFGLAKWLNELGIRNSFGQLFQSRDIAKMLTDEAYLGYPTFSKRRSGRFHRHTANGIAPVERELRDKNTTTDPADVIRTATRLFEPLVDSETWEGVQHKLRHRPKKIIKGKTGILEVMVNGLKNPSLFLAGVAVCVGCGATMVARSDRMEYYCGTWDKHRTRGTLAECPCERNGVRQAVLEKYIGKYLDETGRRLELLTRRPDGSHLTDRLEGQEAEAWEAYAAGVTQLIGYLATHHPDEYNTIRREDAARRAEDEEEVRAGAGSKGAKPGSLAARYGKTLDEAVDKALKGDGPKEPPDPFLQDCLAAYRRLFDPSAVAGELSRLDTEHTALVDQWSQLPTPGAKQKAKRKFEELEAHMVELRRQPEDAAEVVTAHWREMNSLSLAITNAVVALKSEAGAEAMRRRAEALRGLICKIECQFAPTGKSGGGRGNARSKLISVTFHPVAGTGTIMVVDGSESNGRERSYGKP
jgi:hypothetical protein